MDPLRNFILKKGTFLSCISYNNAINDPLKNLYFTSPAEAILSLFRESFVRPFELSIGQPLSRSPQRTNEIDDLYLNTFYINELLVIQHLADSNVDRQLRVDPTLTTLQTAIQKDCDDSHRDGFTIPYVPALLYQHGRGIFRVNGRISAYVICRENLLLHTQSFKINKQILVKELQELLSGRAAENPGFPLTSGVIIELLMRYLKDNRERVLEKLYLQPEASGLASSPVAQTNEMPGDLLSRVERPSSMLSPKNPEIFIPTQFSPGGTTAYDAFATVPSDVMRLMALNMSLNSLANLCQTSQRFNQVICMNNEFWALRVQQDYSRRDQTVMRRKPDEWSWKRYYAELSGNIGPTQVLDFIDRTVIRELFDGLNFNIRDDYEPRVNELRREAGLGEVDFNRADFQATRKPARIFGVRRRL